jgi:hypothetical protein
MKMYPVPIGLEGMWKIATKYGGRRSNGYEKGRTMTSIPQPDYDSDAAINWYRAELKKFPASLERRLFLKRFKDNVKFRRPMRTNTHAKA